MRKLHVAIDLRIADAPGMEMTGAGRYALETARSLQRARPHWRFTLFSNRTALPGINDGATIRRTRLPTNRGAMRVLWLHTAAVLPALASKPDVWFSPSFTLPVWWRGRAVVTIHDLTFLLLRARYRGRANSWYASWATRWSARRSDRVLCGSHATKDLLASHLSVDPDKVQVIPYGVADTFFTDPDGPGPDGRSGAASTQPYVLFVGTWEARKGLGTLHAALRTINAETPRLRLVLAGQPGWGTAELLRALHADPSVEFCELPSDEQLSLLYRDALALVYPSEMEGFGLPVAEAMACGCPVVASDLPSIREFAAECPLYIRPGDSARLADHLELLLKDGEVTRERRVCGREVAAPLRWARLGERTAEVLESAADQPRPATGATARS